MMSDSVSNEAHLMLAVQRHERAALENLYDRYASLALGWALKMLNEHAIAEEVVQEAFWLVWQHAASFDTRRGNFATWLFSIVRHLAIDELRKAHSREPQANVLLSELPPHVEFASSMDVAEQVWLNFRSSKLKVALAALPKLQRKVVELAYFDGLTHHEIAQQLGEPLGTIHTRIRLALHKLKSSLGELHTHPA